MDRRRAAIVAAAVVLAAALVPAIASAWTADFFEGRASGQAVYEDMSIHPQAVHVGDTTYVVYQGEAMDPYIVAFKDGSSQVDGPYRIGDNPAVGGINHDDPSDSHGAPALLHDPATGQLHVFWGAHLTPLQYASTVMPGDISRWHAARSIATNVTYPQPMIGPEGTLRVFMRLDVNPGETRKTTANLGRGSWTEIVSMDHGANWSKPSDGIVLRANSVNRWYAHFEQGSDGRIHAAMALDRINNSDAFERFGVFYAVRDADGMTWRDPAGASIVSSSTLGIQESDVASDTFASAVCTGTADYRNQISIAVDESGLPALLYLSGQANAFGAESHAWTFSRFSGASWETTEVAKTDHLMDSGVLDYREDGTLEAFVTMEGTQGLGRDGSSLLYRYIDRGGDVVRWTADPEGREWTRDERWPLKRSNLDAGIVYNDPQLVVDGGEDARLIFGEWDNDAGNYVHKVYLWGPGSGLRGKEFFPEPNRLAGRTRYETAVAVSQEGFPTGANYVLVASGEGYADALAGVPLAEAYKAPLLLVPKGSVPASVSAEIKRLAAEYVIVLGGESTVAEMTLGGLKVGSVKSVRRISGANRYALSAAVARELANKRGTSHMAFVVAGDKFPDALAAAPLAAVKGAPILLTRPGTLPTETAGVLSAYDMSDTIVVGGTSSVSERVFSRLPSPERVDGANRYEVSARLARLALGGGMGVSAGTLRTDRVMIASGEVFPDALAGGALAARFRAPVFLTAGSSLSPATARVLDDRARRVLDYYFIGGESTLTEPVESAVTDVLREHQSD